MAELFLLAADEVEASVIAARAVSRTRKPVPRWWLIEPIDPPAPRIRRLFDWWEPRLRLFRVTLEPEELAARIDPNLNGER